MSNARGMSWLLSRANRQVLPTDSSTLTYG